MSELGYLPDPDDFPPEELLDQVLSGARWLFEPGFRRLDPEYAQRADRGQQLAAQPPLRADEAADDAARLAADAAAGGADLRHPRRAAGRGGLGADRLRVHRPMSRPRPSSAWPSANSGIPQASRKARTAG